MELKKNGKVRRLIACDESSCKYCVFYDCLLCPEIKTILRNKPRNGGKQQNHTKSGPVVSNIVCGSDRDKYVIFKELNDVMEDI